MEHCLYPHIYTPASARDLPVVFHIHGDFFSYGSVNLDEAKYLIDCDVVYVSVNYRLGVLGFLSSRDHVVPGNMGLKDQSMALRWVRDNIRDCGGDPGRVTLTGVDAGGASVHLQMLSPMSRGLFRHGMEVADVVKCMKTLPAEKVAYAQAFYQLEIENFNCAI
uniref:Carboxylesterase type B domain-containing protein n=1 Tax=Trichogramma kaykai TaxID=54128 RepID=A0ABD2VTQ4_9HYME